MNQDRVKILTKLMELDNKKADKYLAEFSNEIKRKIKTNKDNDDIFNNLELLEEFIYKASNQALEIVNHIVNNPKPNKIKVKKTPYGDLEGKSHKDLILKCIELLNHIRYIKINEVLSLLVQLYRQDDKDIKEETGEAIKKLAKYDYNVLTKSKLGYAVQRKVLDFILNWPIKKRLENIDFIGIAVKELFGSSVEGTSRKDEKTLVLHSAVVQPTEFLKKLRRESIDLIYDLYQKVDDPKIRLKLLNVLGEASQGPVSINYGENVQKMLSDDSKYLIDIYRKMIFDKSGQIIAEPAIIEEIEQRLYWFCKNKESESIPAAKLREDILKDKFYQLFRLLVGDPIAYREEEGWAVADEKKKKEINKQFELMKEEKLDEWINDLNKIASQYGIMEEWKFQEFRAFLQRIAELKPELAEKILEDTFKENKPLKLFTASILRGFRHADRIGLWNSYVQKILKEKDIQLVNDICFSLNLNEGIDLSKKIRKNDLDLLEDIIKQQRSFTFLKDRDDYVRHYALINTLARIYKRDPKRMEKLIIEEIKRNPKYLELYFRDLSTATHRNWLDAKGLTHDIVKFLVEKMIKLRELDWHTQELLFNISNNDLKLILDVFMGRIQKDDTKKNIKVKLKVRDYEAIPYHFNPDLKEFIAKHPDYKKNMEKWIENMKTEWTIYGYNVSRFLHSIGGSLDEIIMFIIKKGDDASLMRAVRALHSLGGADLNLCMEIVKRTDNDKILNQIGSILYATGVVSGEYGIAEAFERRIEELKEYKNDKSSRVKKFVTKMIKSFGDSAKKERERTDEEKMLRKIEFEG